MKIALSIPLLALAACSSSRPPDPLLSEREPKPEVTACMEQPDAGSSELEGSALAAIEDAKPYPLLPDAAACLRGLAFRAIFRNPAR